MHIGWMYLILSIITMALGTSLMYLSVEQPSNSYINLAVWLLLIVSFWFLGRSMYYFKLSQVLAVWAGSSIALTAIIAALCMGESITLTKTLFLLLTIVGITGVGFSMNH